MVSLATSPAGRRVSEGQPHTAAATSVILLGGSLATAAAAVAGNGNVVVVLVPVTLAVAGWVMCVSPIRASLFTVIFLSLALDATGEGKWDSPVARLGALLAFNLNKSIPLGALSFPGVAVILALLLAVHLHRRLADSSIDSIGRPDAPAPLLGALGVSMLAVALLIANGVRHGGDLQMAKNQVQSFVLLLLVAYLAAVSMRGVRDCRILGKLIVAAACIKAANVLYIVHTVAPGYELASGELAFATSHGDSLLFALAIVILVATFAEQPAWRNGKWCALLLPLLLAGTAANNRRLAWVELVAGLLVLSVVYRRTRLKRLVVHAALLALPLFAIYVAIGWDSTARFFAPISVYRSLSDSQVDQSTLYRDAENFNLLATLRVNPLFGTGFGQPFLEPTKMADISFFKEYRYLPHNSVLGLWAFTGAFGFTVLCFPVVVAVYFAGRSYRVARSPEQRVAAIMALAAVAIYVIHCWGDIGFSERKSIFLVGPALAAAGQLAASTGAWRGRSRQATRALLQTT